MKSKNIREILSKMDEIRYYKAWIQDTKERLKFHEQILKECKKELKKMRGKK